MPKRIAKDRSFTTKQRESAAKSAVTAKTKDAAPTTLQMHDAFVMDGVRRTADGYLAAYARVAKTGIQIYKGRELHDGRSALPGGLKDSDDVRVYRPESEVFSADSLKSFAHRPITLSHPKDAVNSRNWKKYAVGQTGDEVVRDGEFVRVPMAMMDQTSIDAYEKDGIKELSMGYSTELKWGKGLTTDGQEYDATQTDIRCNHLAVVPAARGGKDLRIGDQHYFVHPLMTGPTRDDDGTTKCPECGADVPDDDDECPACGHDMTLDASSTKDANSVRSHRGDRPMKMITVDGVPVEMEDHVAAIVQRQLAKNDEQAKTLGDQIAKLTTDAATFAKSLDDEKKKVEAKDGEIAVLKKQVEDAKVTPEKLDTMVKDRMAVIDKAKAIVDKSYVFDGKTVEAIRKDAVVAKLGDAAKGMSDAAIDGAFAALTVDAKTGGGARDIGRALFDQRNNVQVVDERDAALAEREKRQNTAWQAARAS